MPALARTNPVGEPPIAVPVPRAPDIIAAPIVSCHEAYDGDSKFYEAHVRQRHQLPAIIERQIFAVHPAAIVFPNNVAPGLILKAALDVDRFAFGNDGDRREFDVRPRAHIHIGRRKSWLSVR